MIFISHASEDDPLVALIRQRLEARDLPVWTDSQRLRGGDVLAPAIEEAIRTAPAVLAVLSVAALNSAWVQRELRCALEASRANGGTPRVVPLLLPPLEPAMLGLLFGEEPLALRLGPDPNALDLLLPDLLAALGQVAPDDPGEDELQAARPVAELVLRLSRPEMFEEEGKRRPRAEARLVLVPADDTPRVESRAFRLTAPLGALDAEDLTWYLEDWPRWPNEALRYRAQRGQCGHRCATEAINQRISSFSMAGGIIGIRNQFVRRFIILECLVILFHKVLQFT